MSDLNPPYIPKPTRPSPDIVDRLRNDSLCHCHEAADEIERLRQHAEIITNTLNKQDSKIERWHKALTAIAKGEEWEMAEIIALAALNERDDK